MKMEKTVWGSFNGEDVILATLRSGKYRFSVMTKGATIVYWGTGDWNAVLTHPVFDDYLKAGNGHRGEVVGPYANRIENASFTLDGTVYNLDKNFNVNHSLHSGSANWGDRVWDIKSADDESITLTLSTPDGDGGFPGAHTAEITYTITAVGTLKLRYTVHSDKKCPVAVTNHAYFILDDRDTRFLTLTVPAERFIDVDENLIPLRSTPTDVASTDYDFRTPHVVGARRGGRYDNSWCLDEDAVVVAEGNRAKLTCRTTEKGIQVYTGANLPKPFRGIALETGQWPNTPNRPDFPQAFTDKDSEYVSETVYTLVVKGE
jgi:aldose 1-epimerase